MKTTDFNTAKARVDSALDVCGIGHDLDERLRKTLDEIADFCAQFQKRAVNQAVYDELTNRPCGIEIGKQHALRSAIVGAVGALVEWDCIGALEIAADIAEDVNAHAEAAQIRGMAAAA